MEVNFTDQNFSFLGKGSSLTGRFNLKGPTHLFSYIEGEVKMADDSKLTIEREGKIKGKINCLNIDIHGTFEGIIEAKGKVTIFPSANISGQIIAEQLKIHPGATINFEGHTLQ